MLNMCVQTPDRDGRTIIMQMHTHMLYVQNTLPTWTDVSIRKQSPQLSLD